MRIYTRLNWLSMSSKIKLWCWLCWTFGFFYLGDDLSFTYKVAYLLIC